MYVYISLLKKIDIHKLPNVCMFDSKTLYSSLFFGVALSRSCRRIVLFSCPCNKQQNHKTSAGNANYKWALTVTLNGMSSSITLTAIMLICAQNKQRNNTY